MNTANNKTLTFDTNSKTALNTLVDLMQGSSLLYAGIRLLFEPSNIIDYAVKRRPGKNKRQAVAVIAFDGAEVCFTYEDGGQWRLKLSKFATGFNNYFLDLTNRGQQPILEPYETPQETKMSNHITATQISIVFKDRAVVDYYISGDRENALFSISNWLCNKQPLHIRKCSGQQPVFDVIFSGEISEGVEVMVYATGVLCMSNGGFVQN